MANAARGCWHPFWAADGDPGVASPLAGYITFACEPAAWASLLLLRRINVSAFQQQALHVDGRASRHGKRRVNERSGQLADNLKGNSYDT
jgi:hypothetical protein